MKVCTLFGSVYKQLTSIKNAITVEPRRVLLSTVNQFMTSRGTGLKGSNNTQYNGKDIDRKIIMMVMNVVIAIGLSFEKSEALRTKIGM